jgi:predicted O-methyltransferase YrrM
MTNIPNLSPDFLIWIEKNNFTDKTIVEIGSGFSTIFFTNHFNFVYSFEDNEDWFTKMKVLSKENNIDNLKLSKFDAETIKKDDFIDLISTADVFLIDNNPTHIPRSTFAQIINKHKKEGSIIVLDNGTWNIDAYRILRENYYCIDFPYERETGEKTETSVFFKKIERKNKQNLI